MSNELFDNLLESVNTSIAGRLFEIIHLYPTREAIEKEIFNLRKTLPKARESVQRVRRLKLVIEDIDKLGMRLVGFDTTPVDAAEVFIFDSKEHPAEDWGMKSHIVDEMEEVPPIVKELLKTSFQSTSELRQEIEDVRYGDPGTILFTFRGDTYAAKEPTDVMPVGHGEASKSWGLKQLLGGKAKVVNSSENESKVEEADKNKVDRVDAEQTMKPQEEDTEVLAPDHMEDYSKDGEEEKGSKSKGTDNELKELPDEKLDHEVTYESTAPLYLCNSCCRTFRSTESKCSECESEDVEKLVEEQADFSELACQTIEFYKKARSEGRSREEAAQVAAKGMNISVPQVRNILLTQNVDTVDIPVEEEKGEVSHMKKPFKVKFTKDGKEEETRYMGFDEADVRRSMQKNPKVKVINVVPVKEEKGEVSHLKKIYNVKFTKDGKKEETRHMGFSEDEVRKEMEKNPKVKVTDVVLVKEGSTPSDFSNSPVKETRYEVWYKDNNAPTLGVQKFGKYGVVAASERDAVKHVRATLDEEAPGNEFELVKVELREIKVTERVAELIAETPGIDLDQQQILHWGLENNILPLDFPEMEAMIDHLSYAEVPDVDPDGLDLGEIEASYVKYVLLPKAKEAYFEHTANEKLSVGALKAVQGPVLRFDYGTAANHEDIMKDFAITDYFQRSMVGSRITLVNARGIDMTFAKDDDQQWKEWSEKFGFMAEAKLDEQDKDYSVAGKGISDEQAAKDLARDKGGIVVPDEEDSTKFQVIVKEQ